MADWKKDLEAELDQFLFPQGVLFSREAIGREFMKELKALVTRARLPFFTAILLRNGIGSWIWRIASLILLVACVLAITLAEPSHMNTTLLIIVCITAATPGIWMWSYCLLPFDDRMDYMIALFHRKCAKVQHDPLKK